MLVLTSMGSHQICFSPHCHRRHCELERIRFSTSPKCLHMVYEPCMCAEYPTECGKNIDAELFTKHDLQMRLEEVAGNAALGDPGVEMRTKEESKIKRHTAIPGKYLQLTHQTEHRFPRYVPRFHKSTRKRRGTPKNSRHRQLRQDGEMQMTKNPWKTCLLL